MNATVTAVPLVSPARLAAVVAPVVVATRELAAARLQSCPPGAARKNVVRAVKNLTSAVAEVERASDPAVLEVAIGRMGVKTVELVSLFENHPDPLSRALSVMRRVAPHVLGDDQAGPIASWCAALEAGDR